MVALATSPLSVIAGKIFAHSWVLAEAATGPVTSLDGFAAFEVRASRVGLPEGDVVWSIDSGHIVVVNDEIVLTVTGDETEDLAIGQWRWLLSYGETEAETPLVQGTFKVTAEP